MNIRYQTPKGGTTIYAAMTKLIDTLDTIDDIDHVLGWACPVPFFGSISGASVATVGINPSNREFVDRDGRELQSDQRRFPTLGSLSIADWSDVDGHQIAEIVRACVRYFEINPYRQWFDVLDRLLCAGGKSYYHEQSACHIDLVAFATGAKWGAIDSAAKRSLIERNRRPMAELIRDSPVQVLVLNGRAVVREFENFTGNELAAEGVDEWMLPRTGARGVPGIAYKGHVSSIGDIDLGREISVFGFNHNLQSSFGVTTHVISNIANRIGEEIGSATD